MTEPKPKWQFWHPLSFWKALGIMLVAVFVANLLTALVTTAFGWNASPAIGGGLGGALGATLIMIFAQKAREKKSGGR